MDVSILQARTPSFYSLLNIQYAVLCLTQHMLRKYLLSKFTNKPSTPCAFLLIWEFGSDFGSKSLQSWIQVRNIMSEVVQSPQAEAGMAKEAIPKHATIFWCGEVVPPGSSLGGKYSGGGGYSGPLQAFNGCSPCVCILSHTFFFFFAINSYNAFIKTKPAFSPSLMTGSILFISQGLQYRFKNDPKVIWCPEADPEMPQGQGWNYQMQSQLQFPKQRECSQQ